MAGGRREGSGILYCAGHSIFSFAALLQYCFEFRISLCAQGNVAGEDMLLVLFSLEESSQINYAMMGELLSLIKCLRALGPPLHGRFVP